MTEGWRRNLGTALILFVAAWGIRVLFLHATPDAQWPYSFGFQGDAIVFLQHAGALQQGIPFELGLPLRAPGTAHLIAWIWDGSTDGIVVLRHVWVVMGALLAPTLFLTTRHALGDEPAFVAGCYTAIATGPMLLSSALSSETPYLLLATASVGMVHAVAKSEGIRLLMLWSALQAVCCLLRPEHILFAIPALLLAVHGQGRWFARVGTALAVFVAAMLPWHLSAWSAIARLNEDPVTPVQFSMRWTQEARDAVATMPAFARASSVRLIEETVAVRRRRLVEADDLKIVEQAYGYTPEPLTAYPFVAVSGPMNFYLANHPASHGRFSRAALFELPSLPNGLRFPKDLMSNIARLDNIELSYPPHIRILEHGYAMGIDEIRAKPEAWFEGLARKFTQMWAGAAHGVGGYALPLGISGVRHRVDLVVSDQTWAWMWHIFVLLVCLAGVVVGFQHRQTWPWLLWILARLLVVLLFYGYARHGALLTPAIGILLGVVVDRFCTRFAYRVGIVLLLAALATEGYRWIRPPLVTVDGAVVRATDPFARSTDVRRIEVR